MWLWYLSWEWFTTQTYCFRHVFVLVLSLWELWCFLRVVVQYLPHRQSLRFLVREDFHLTKEMYCYIFLSFSFSKTFSWVRKEKIHLWNKMRVTLFWFVWFEIFQFFGWRDGKFSCSFDWFLRKNCRRFKNNHFTLEFLIGFHQIRELKINKWSVTGRHN